MLERTVLFFCAAPIVGVAMTGCHGPPRAAATELIEAKPFVAPEPKKGPPFDPRAARGALWQVDVAHCKAQGVPPGRGHAYVTFAPAGGVSKVTVDLPWDLPAAGSKCIADALSKVIVTEFNGNPATIGASWVVP
jgi:hypothetical protein